MIPIAALSPLPPAERIEAMDVLRGFALLGILLMNIEAFAGPLIVSLTGLDPTLTGIDRWVDAAVYILVQGKFYLLFSLLFGMGFAVMGARAQAAGRAFVPLYLRRTLALLAIGLAHLLLVWSGDILTSYALLALPLLLVFREVPTGHLPYWAAGLFVLVLAMVVGLGALGSLMQLEPNAAKAMNEGLQQQAAQVQALLEGQREAYGGGSYREATLQRARDGAFLLSQLLVVGWQVLAMFVLGAWFVRSGAIARPQEFPRLYARLRHVALPLGLAMVLLAFWMMPTADFARLDVVAGIATSLQLTGALLMSLGYLAWVMRGVQSPAWRPRLRVLAPAGRMALSNYLVQSLVCTLVFYGYGLGWFERMPRAWQLPFALVLFALQVACSRWWLQRFRFGPAEWLWRGLTYGQWPAMRREPAVA